MNTVKSLACFAAFTAGLVSFPALSDVEVQEWDFSNPPQSFVGGSNNGNSLVMSSGSVGLTVTGWADTGCGWSCGTDSEIFDAELNWQWSGSSLGLYNRDENTPSRRGSPDHAIDSNGGDYDMLLLTFDQAVSLTGVDLRWATGGGSNRADVSILAWAESQGSSALQGKTWSTILAGGGGGGGYVSSGNYNIGLAPYNSITPVIESTQWLIGAYNAVFDSTRGSSHGYDAFKLDSVTTTYNGGDGGGEVPVPGSLALLALGLLILRDQRRHHIAA